MSFGKGWLGGEREGCNKINLSRNNERDNDAACVVHEIIGDDNRVTCVSAKLEAAS